MRHSSPISKVDAGREAQLPRGSDVAKAMDYMLKRWTAFTRFLDDGRIGLSNNAAERALRGIALGRKSWLFAGSDRDGQRSAAMYSLIVTAKMNDIDPKAGLSSTRPHRRASGPQGGDQLDVCFIRRSERSVMMPEWKTSRASASSRRRALLHIESVWRHFPPRSLGVSSPCSQQCYTLAHPEVRAITGVERQ